MPRKYISLTQYQTIKIEVPDSIQRDLEKMLFNYIGKKPSERKLHLFYLFIHLIIIRRNILELKPEDYVRLDSKILSVRFGSNYKTKIINPLSKLGIIDNPSGYSTTRRECKKYRLSSKYQHEPLQVIEVKVKDDKKKVEKSINLITQNLLAKTTQFEYKFLRDSLLKLDINEKEAKKFCKKALEKQIPLKDKVVKINGRSKVIRNRKFNELVYKKYEASIFLIKNGIHNFKVCPNHRISNSFVSLPSLLLPFTYVQGYQGKMHYIDLSQSQVVLLIPMIENFIRENNLPFTSDAHHFIQLAKGENFYLNVSDLLRLSGVTIKSGEEKTKFFQHVQYRDEQKSLSSRSHYRIAFNLNFPDMNRFYQENKKTNHEFANKMTKIEANIFINKICLRIFKEVGNKMPVFTRHDGLVYTDENAPQIRHITEDELKKYLGFIPHLKEKVWDSTPDDDGKIKGFSQKSALKQISEVDIEPLLDITAKNSQE